MFSLSKWRVMPLIGMGFMLSAATTAKYSSLICIVLLTLCWSGVLSARTFSVNTTKDNVDENPGDGFCANDNKQCSLRAAIQEANASIGEDTIILGKATYTLNIPTKLASPGQYEKDITMGDLDITDHLIIQGAGPDNSIIDGGQNDRVLQILAGSNLQGSNVTISGVTVTNGFPQLLTDTGQHGGGISVVDNSTLTLSNCIIKNNRARNGGGIYSFYYSTIKVTDCIISNNESENGGGIYSAFNSKAYVDVSVVNNNTATNLGGGINNGGINNITQSLAVITKSTIKSNEAQRSGGGIYNSYQSEIIIDNSTVYDNQAESGGGVSSALFSGSIIRLHNSTVSGNRAGVSGGGGLYGSGNSETLEIANSTITNNYAGSGKGGGIANYISNVSVSNSIVAGNVDPGSIASDCYESSLISSGNNIFGINNNLSCNIVPTMGDHIGSAINPVNPLLAPLSDNGGPTITHALLPNSPAIDAGNLLTPGSGGNSCELTDQRGVLRIGRGACDIGAFEATGGGDVWVTLENSNEVAPSRELLQQIIKAGNKGPYRVSMLLLTATVPIGSQNLTITGEDWSCISNANSSLCNRPTLNSQTETTLVLQFMPPVDTKNIITQASISTISDEPLENNNQAQLETIVNSAPMVTARGIIKYNTNSDAVLLAPEASIVDDDDILLSGATLQFIQGYQRAEDALYWNGNASILSRWQTETATLFLSGEARLTDYEQALREIVYENKATTSDLSQRGIQITVHDAYTDSAPAVVALTFTTKEEDESTADSKETSVADDGNPFAADSSESQSGDPDNTHSKSLTGAPADAGREGIAWILGGPGRQGSGLGENSTHKVAGIYGSLSSDVADYESAWLTMKKTTADHNEMNQQLVLFSAGVTFYAGAVGMYLRFSGLLGFFFSFPLWSPVDPIPVLFLASKEKERRRKETQRSQDLENKNEKIGKLLDE